MKFLRVGLCFILVVSQLVVFAPATASATDEVAAVEEQSSVVTTQEAEVTSVELSPEVAPTETLQSMQGAPVEPAPVLLQDNVEPPAPVVLQPLKITEVQVSGKCVLAKCASTNSAEFIELFNPNDTEVSLADYELVFQNKSGTMTSVAVFGAGQRLTPKQFAIVARDLNAQQAAVIGTIGIANGLVDGAGAVLLLETSGAERPIVDQVAWGDITTGFYGDKPATAPATNKSLQRCFNGAALREFDPRATAQEFIVYTNELPTPGAGLECEKPVIIPAVNRCEGLKINEIGANLTDQYIEIRNDAQAPIDMAGCQLQTNRSSTKSYVFAEEVLQPGSLRLVFIKDTALTLTKTTSGVVYILSSDGLSEVDTQAYTGLASDTAWAYFADGWLQTYAVTPGAENIAQKYLPCDDGYIRNSETGRCNKIVTAATAADCGEGKYRNEETGRCRAIPAASVLAACKLGQYRSEETNRCRNIVAASTQKPCKDNQYRSEETNRCRNLTATSVPDASFAVQPVKEGPMVFMGWWLLGGIALLAVGYAGWEWRSEVRMTMLRAVSFFSGKK